MLQKSISLSVHLLYSCNVPFKTIMRIHLLSMQGTLEHIIRLPVCAQYIVIQCQMDLFFHSISCLKQMFLFGLCHSCKTYLFLWIFHWLCYYWMKEIYIHPYYNQQGILNHTVWEMSHFLPEETFGTILLPVQITLISFHVTFQFGLFSEIHDFFLASFFGFLDYKCKLKKMFFIVFRKMSWTLGPGSKRYFLFNFLFIFSQNFSYT